ncbi:hypothetical protein SO802_003932 [Lithocarpus litseifolius]|uniref:Neutral ceramidase n=1 Tax=Lithocarpus litseifolius TaxID=425828 RepID=A0AAW2E1L4_9ROSI
MQDRVGLLECIDRHVVHYVEMRFWAIACFAKCGDDITGVVSRLCLAKLRARATNGDYLIGVGSFDMTGPAAGVNMMGYANMYQSTAGIQFRLRARTFVVAESSQGPRFAFVNLDAGMASQLITIKVLERLKSRFGDLYTEENVAISGIHTHAGPGGYLQYLVYSITSLGFVHQSFDAIVNAIELSIVRRAGSRPRQVQLLDSSRTGSLLNTNSSSTPVTNSSNRSRAFCQSHVGDVTPNVLGAFCIDSGKPCDFNHSSCHGNDQLCMGRGPGYPNEILSTQIIGERQYQKAVDLFISATEELTGKIDYRHVYLNFTDIEVELDGNNVVKTCPAALGPGFAAGTTDGPGINKLWRKLRDLLKEPSQFQVQCQKPKTVLLDTGEMFVPYAWAAAILPIQKLRLGKLIILSVPGEFTTMVGRRLREAVKETLKSNGNGEFNNNTEVIIAGLTNTYSQYVATFEEYEQQRYEAASTLYGPHTLSAYIQEFKKLAEAMAKGEKIMKGPSPPDLFKAQLCSLLPDPFGDSPPPGTNFGDMKQDIIVPKNGTFTKGDKASATFWSANPRYDLLTEGTFAVVEMLQGQHWTPVYDDDDFSLFFKWKVDDSYLYSMATIE